ncbi:amidase [Microvirga sp. VF16]|uniref:amidase n=1 Tax=Microvirga sp. VF16 TaxID=2807101 RepID=UPI00193D40CC|nr:amidase [Microvirga sp. VF16]QRM33142.1 amidase [Microvirga sp. VF16]
MRQYWKLREMTHSCLTLYKASQQLVQGTVSAEALLDACLAQIDAAAGEGHTAFTAVFRETARAEAQAADRLLRAGCGRGRLLGLPISVKALFDVKGQVTHAGAAVLREKSPSLVDSTAVARLRAEGAVIIGHTSMSEFAFTGLGLNPHFGTPRSPWRRDERLGRAPGGSSSGSAVSVADGMALATIGTDTGGSGRIPAAFCGITGFKPTRGRIPTQGSFPLAASFDTVAPMARDVADCRLLTEVLCGVSLETVAPAQERLRLGVVPPLAIGPHDDPVLAAFEAALMRLTTAGVSLSFLEDVDWAEPIRVLMSGRITAVEGLAAHGALFDRRSEYDPIVAERLFAALTHPAVEYVTAQMRMAQQREVADALFDGIDAMVLPTVAIAPPRLDDLTDPAEFARLNALALRNTQLANVLDLCAVSLPLRCADGTPTGLMLMGRKNYDAELLALAETISVLL